jgi:predicted ABC-type ATPase
MPDLYIIAGCNGAGKTTASFTILPQILNCKEFVNADSIAAGLSPFNPESVALERRYYRGIYNLLNLYISVVDNWMVIDNMDTSADIIAKGSKQENKDVKNPDLWDVILKQSKSYGK